MTLARLISERSRHTRTRLDCTDGTLVIHWPHGVASHELAKLQGLRGDHLHVLEQASVAVDLEGAIYHLEPKGTP